MKRSVLMACVAASLAALSAEAQAQQTESNWMVRVRALSLEPANDFKANGAALAGATVEVNDKWIPEVDVSYFFTKNIAAELVLTVPQKQDVSVNGSNIGTFKHLPPSLLLQYHFIPEGQFRPYVGAGVNYTILSDEKMSALGGDVTLDNHSVGAVIQAGFDYKIDKQLFLNFDVKKAQIRTDVYHSAAGNVGTLKVDPLLWGVGIGYRF